MKGQPQQPLPGSAFAQHAVDRLMVRRPDLPLAHVEVVITDLLGVAPNIQGHGQHLLRSDTASYVHSSLTCMQSRHQSCAGCSSSPGSTGQQSLHWFQEHKDILI